ncbi:hypothetical protein Tco_1437652 [Tanacetum coccineum]
MNVTGIDDLDETINEKARELLTNEEPDSFLSRGLEKSIDQSDLECCESTSSNDKNGSDSENLIRHIDSINTSYPVTQGTSNEENVKSEHMYSVITNEIDEKKPELKNLPQHLEYHTFMRHNLFPSHQNCPKMRKHHFCKYEREEKGQLLGKCRTSRESVRHTIQRISLTGFPAQSVGSSNTDVLDSPCLLVLITGTSQSRQHVITSLIHIESCKSPTKSLFDVGSSRISIFTVNT